MGNFLSEERLSYLNQSESTRKILDTEAANDARARQAEKLEQAEKDYAASQRIAKGKLRDEWTTVSGYKDKHQRTGRLVLDGAPVCDGDRLLLFVSKPAVEVTVRYSTRGALREIDSAWGDSTSGESVRLSQGQRAKRLEALEEPGPVGWHLKYSSKSHKWRVIKDDLCGGEFADLQEAQELCTLLQSYDKRQPSTDIHFRQV